MWQNELLHAFYLYLGDDSEICKEFGIVAKVESGSPAWKLGIREGDRITRLADHPLIDILDYRFYAAERQVSIAFVDSDSGLTRTGTVIKDYDEDLGLEFCGSGLEEIRLCRNKCVFCFVDQLPPEARDSLRVKDDDYVHSFLNGNYVSLTNCSDGDIERIIRLRLTPLYVSVHSTEPELRLKMMKNPHSAGIMDQLRKLADGGISIHAQLVLVPGVNDGEHLGRSLADLADLHPRLVSVAAVPIGLTGHRQGLDELRPYTPNEALAVIEQIRGFADSALTGFGTRFVWAADEFYLKAGVEIPADETYEDYPQLDNGVGLVRRFLDSFAEEAETRLAKAAEPKDEQGSACRPARVTIATAVSAAPVLEGVIARMPTDRWDVEVVPVVNRFFGETVTVAGLMTGGDILRALEHIDLGDYLIIPDVCLRDKGDTFLDDMTLDEFRASVSVPVSVCEATGEGLAKALFAGPSGRTKNRKPRFGAPLRIKPRR